MTEVGKSGLNSGAPEMWPVLSNSKHYCIYRVPDRIRKVNPSAYTPQLLIIGPLHHSLKAQASRRRVEDMETTRFTGYLIMEKHKKSYLSAFAERFDGEEIITGFRRVIKEEEEAIRKSYSESTTKIESKEFIEMILQDSVFILEFILRCSKRGRSSENAGDVLMKSAQQSSQHLFHSESRWCCCLEINYTLHD